MKKLPISLLQQNHPNNCWATALAMALEPLHINKSEQDLDILFGASQQGLNLDEVHQALSRNFPGLKSILRSKIFTGTNPVLSLQEIKDYIDAGQPILIGVQNFTSQNSITHNAHALLIYGYNDNGGVLIADP